MVAAILWLVIVNELYVGEGEMTDLATQFSLPLAVDGHFCDFDNIADL